MPNLFPEYDELQTAWRARILSAILLASVPLTTLLAFAVYFLVSGFSAELAIVLLVLIFEILVWALWHQRGLDMAAHVLVFGSWIIVASVVLFSGGMTSMATIAQLFVVITAALLTSTVVTLGVLTGTAGFNTAVILFDLYVGLPEAPLDESLPVRFAIHTMILVLSGATLLYASLTSRNLIESLADSERKFRALFEKSSDSVFLLGLDFTVTNANENASKILGYRPGELVGKPFRHLVAPEDLGKLRAQLEQARSGGVSDTVQSRFMTKSGSQVVMDETLALVRGDSGRPLQYQCTARDVTEKVNQERQIQTALATMAVRANTDYLTGTLNRDAVLQHAEAEWARHKREGRPLSVMLMDMDKLKDINDTYGHTVGDQALKLLVDTLEKNKRPYDWLGRYGGDEFMLVLPGTTLTIAREIATRMQAAVEQHTLRIDSGEVPISCSFGVASTSSIKEEAASIMDLVKSADAALYEEKARKKRSIP